MRLLADAVILVGAEGGSCDGSRQEGHSDGEGVGGKRVE